MTWKIFVIIQLKSLGSFNFGRLKTLIFLYPFDTKYCFGPKRTLWFLTNINPHLRLLPLSLSFSLLSNPHELLNCNMFGCWEKKMEFWISYLRFFDFSFLICNTRNFIESFRISNPRFLISSRFHSYFEQPQENKILVCLRAHHFLGKIL